MNLKVKQDWFPKAPLIQASSPKSKGSASRIAVESRAFNLKTQYVFRTPSLSQSI